MKIQVYATVMIGALLLSSFGARLSRLAPTGDSLATSDACKPPGKAKWDQVQRISDMCFPDQRLAWECCSCVPNSGEPVRSWAADGSEPATGEQRIRIRLDPATGDVLQVSCRLPDRDSISLTVRNIPQTGQSEKAPSWLERVDRAAGVRARWRLEDSPEGASPKDRGAPSTPYVRMCGRGNDGRLRRAHVRLDPNTGELVQILYRY